MTSASPAIAAPVRGYRYFPGWTMLTVAAAANYMSAPGQSHSVAAFKEPMRETLSLSETQFSFAYAVATILSGLLLPFTGRLLDRYGARRLLPVVGLLLGGGCLSMSYAEGLGGVLLGFSLIRVMGQGALCLCATWLVGEWFERRRGFATAAAGLGGSLSVMTFPLINGFLISNYGWETGWAVMAWLVWIVLVGPGLLLIRDRPEDLGLHPDGDPPPPATPKPSEDFPTSEPWTAVDVLRDPTFWKLLAVPATSGLVGTGLIFHQVSLLGSRGVSPTWALGLIAIQAVISSCAALGAGWLTDRLPGRYLLCAAMILLATAVATVSILPLSAFAIFYAAVMGLHGSVIRSTGMVVWMTYYGRANQGTIRGCAISVMILCAALGPLPLALAIDYFGSYNAALLSFLIMPLVAAVLVATAKPPMPRGD